MSKFLDLAGLTAYDRMLKEWFKAGVVDITDEAIKALFPVIQPDNEIWYTSSDGDVVNPYMTDAFVVNIISNTYENGKGVITFDGDVTSIGDHAFRFCGLTSIVLPNSLTEIKGFVFEGTDLTSVVIPDSVISIGDQAFNECRYLTSIVIPKNVMSIGDNNFTWGNSLTSIVVSEGNTVYDSRENCNAIIETATNTLICGCQNTIIPNSVTSIGGSAFAGCKYLNSITIPESVTNIEGWAFQSCESLTSITIPNSVMSIGDRAFQYSSSLNSITFQGTMAEWNTITKGNNWNYNVPATYVQCTDGQVTL